MKKTKIFQKCFIGILFIAAGGLYLGTSITRTFGSNEKVDHSTMIDSNAEMSQFSELNPEENLVVTPVGIQDDKTQEPSEQANNSNSVLIPSANEEKDQMIVHVCGCVMQPDVYELQEGARLIDAVKAAGGFTENAASDSVNQAQLLKDGQKIYIPSKEEMEEGFLVEESEDNESDSIENHLINLNLATKEELMTLPGIGEAKADRILVYRNEHGKFQTIDDIKQIAGVKEAIFSKVKDYITVK